MTRLNIEEEAFRDSRLSMLAQSMQIPPCYAMGLLAFLWHNCVSRMKTHATEEEIEMWSGCIGSFEHLRRSRWVRPDGDLWYICGTKEQVESLSTWLSKKQLAGIRSAEKRKERFGSAQPPKKGASPSRTDTEQPFENSSNTPEHTSNTCSRGLDGEQCPPLSNTCSTKPSNTSNRARTPVRGCSAESSNTSNTINNLQIKKEIHMEEVLTNFFLSPAEICSEQPPAVDACASRALVDDGWDSPSLLHEEAETREACFPDAEATQEPQGMQAYPEAVLPPSEPPSGPKKHTPRPTGLTPRRCAEIWNEFKHPSQPAIKDPGRLAKDRESKVKARLVDYPTESEWVEAVKDLAAWPHAIGQNDRGWKGDFDYLVSTKGRKCFEGGLRHHRTSSVRYGSNGRPDARSLLSRREDDEPLTAENW